MERIYKKNQQRLLRKHRVRAIISGTPERPRLSVHISNKNITAQIIDDTQNKTLAHVSTVSQKAAKTMTEHAANVGAEIAKKAKESKISQVVFDRNGKLYHGRIKALAEAARKAGLEF